MKNLDILDALCFMPGASKRPPATSSLIFSSLRLPLAAAMSADQDSEPVLVQCTFVCLQKNHVNTSSQASSKDEPARKPSDRYKKSDKAKTVSIFCQTKIVDDRNHDI